MTPTSRLAAPTATITSPTDDGEAMGQFPITGVASGPAFGYWQLAYRDVSDPSEHWTVFANSATQTTTSGALKVADPLNATTPKALLWDTSLMMDGQYKLCLTVSHCLFLRI